MQRLWALLAAHFVLVSTLSAAPQFGSDSCSTPDVVPPGQGIVYYNGFATTGVEGQGWSMCGFVPTTLIENDVWFLWSAPATGEAQIVPCTSNPNVPQTRVAVYAGAGCPGSIPVECTENQGCDSNFGGRLAFEVEQGSVWLIQVGSRPGTPTGTGTIGLAVKPHTDHVYRYDGASMSGGGTGIGANATGEFLWLNRYNAKGGADSLVQIEVAFGSPFVPNPPLVDGAPARVAIWSDPDQDGNPGDAVLLASVPTTVQNAHTGIPVTVFLPEPVAVQGKFFVGASMAVTAGQSPGVGTGSTVDGWVYTHRAWVGFSSTSIDLSCLGCLNPPPNYLGGDVANLVVRAVGGSDANTYCFGDGSGAVCPCGNTGASGAGCANSSVAGALLWSTGSTKVSTNDLALRATHLPAAGGVGLAVAGSQQQAGGAGIPFQDGLLCVGGQIHRFPAQAFVDSIVQESVVSASNGLITAGSTWNFQVWYRDVVGACGGSTGNLSNALQVAFTP
jgi:hypothetical protein